MQSLDNSIRLRRGRFGWLTSEPGHGEPNPTYIPVANDAARIVADKIDGGPRARSSRRCSTCPPPPTSSAAAPSATTPGRRRDRPLPPGLRPRRPARRRRLGGHRQPRREPVAHHHRHDRAGHGLLAQQGRRRPPARAGRALRAGRPGAAAGARPSPSTPPPPSASPPADHSTVLVTPTRVPPRVSVTRTGDGPFWSRPPASHRGSASPEPDVVWLGQGVGRPTPVADSIQAHQASSSGSAWRAIHSSSVMLRR